MKEEKSDSFRVFKLNGMQWLFISWLPWLFFIFLGSKTPLTAALIGTFWSAVIFIYRYYFIKITIFDFGSLTAFLIITLLAWKQSQFTGNYSIIIAYLLLALIWLGSLFFKKPLMAYYSRDDYSESYSKPLFLKANTIITAVWGAVFIFLAAAEYLKLSNSFNSIYLYILSKIVFLAGAYFTVKFPDWYPLF